MEPLQPAPLRPGHRIRPLQPSDNPAVAAIIRQVMVEMGASGPGFAIHDAEVDDMWSAYRGDQAGYLVLEVGGRVVGGGGFAPLTGGPPEVCELKKMYFVPEGRGLGLGAALLHRVLADAARAGYRTCYLETLETMTRARRLYESFGFRRLGRPLGHTGHFGCDSWYALDLAAGRPDAPRS